MRGLKRKKKFVTLSRVLCTILTIALLSYIIPTSTAFASPWAQSVETSKRTISIKMNDMYNKANIQYAGDSGLLYFADIITRYAIWIDFLEKDTAKGNSIELGTAELKDYKDKFLASVSFGKTLFPDGSPSGLKLELNESDTASTYISKLSKLYDSYLSSIVGKYNAANAEEKEKIISENRKQLKYLYKGMVGISNEIEEANNMIPASNLKDTININVNANLPYYSKIWEYSLDTSQLDALFSKEEYSEILSKAMQIASMDELATSNIELNNADDLVEKFIIDGDTKSLSTAYYACLATGATYVPLKSHAGDTVFTTTLSMLIDGDVSTTREIVDAYSALKKYRKPIYYRDAGKDGTPVGDAKLLTLKDLQTKIENDVKFHLVMGRQKIEMNPDTNSFEYYANTETGVGVGIKYNTPTDTQNNAQNNTQNSSESSEGSNNTENSDSEGNKSSTATSVENQRTSYSLGSITDAISNESEMTKPVVTFGSYNLSNTDLSVYKNKDLVSSLKVALGGAVAWYMTPETILLKNVFSSSQKTLNSLNAESQLLFMNAFGDIVLADETVVLPGSANYTLYNKGWNYYSNTAAVMNFYPRNILSGASGYGDEAYFSKPTDEKIGKYLLGYSTLNEGEDEFTESKNLFRRKIYGLSANRLNSSSIDASLTYTAGWDTKFMINGEPEDLMNSMQVRYEGTGWWNNIKNWFNESKVVDLRFIQPYNLSNEALFPFNYEATDDSLKIAKVIASNMYYVYTSDKDGQPLLDGPNDMLDEGRIITDVLMEASNGLTNAGAVVKAVSNSIENIFDNQANILTETLAKLFGAQLETYKDIEGVVGLKSAFQDAFFGKVLGLLREYFWIILAVLMLFVIIQYMRNSSGFFTAVIMAVLIGIGSYLIVNWVPILIPDTYNKAIERFADNLAFKSLMYKVEQYDKTYGESANSDKTGRFSKRTTSIDLYRLSDSQLKETCEKFNIDEDLLLSGNAVIIDSLNGLYIEGRDIKVNVDRLFYTLPITGDYVDIGNGTKQYQMTAEKTYSSSLDYYTPFYSIVENFTNNLNKFGTIYQLQRETLAYNTTMEKDSFFVKSFMMSAPFLNPGGYYDSEGNIISEDPEEAIILSELAALFGDELDFLGIRSLLANPTNKMEDTLWYMTAKQNGQLTDNRIDTIVKGVNTVTKEFMIKNYYNFLNMSDENIIKSVSLYATMQFNARISSLFSGNGDSITDILSTNIVSPVTLNFEELSLGDVLTCVLVDDYSLFTNSNLDLVNHLLNDYGFFDLLGLNIVLLEIFLIVNLIKYLIPALYILLMVLFIWKFKSNEDKLGLVKGYGICSLFIFGSFLLFCGTLMIACKLAGNPFIIFFMLIVFSLILICLFDVVLGILRNFTELGYGYHGNFTSDLFKSVAMKVPGVRQLVVGMGSNTRTLTNSAWKSYNRYKQSARSAYDDLDDGNVTNIIRDHSKNYMDNKSEYGKSD